MGKMEDYAGKKCVSYVVEGKRSVKNSYYSWTLTMNPTVGTIQNAKPDIKKEIVDNLAVRSLATSHHLPKT